MTDQGCWKYVFSYSSIISDLYLLERDVHFRFHLSVNAYTLINGERKSYLWHNLALRGYAVPQNPLNADFTAINSLLKFWRRNYRKNLRSSANGRSVRPRWVVAGFQIPPSQSNRDLGNQRKGTTQQHSAHLIFVWIKRFLVPSGRAGRSPVLPGPSFVLGTGPPRDVIRTTGGSSESNPYRPAEIPFPVGTGTVWEGSRLCAPRGSSHISHRLRKAEVKAGVTGKEKKKS